jgi:hypothetical protein
MNFQAILNDIKTLPPDKQEEVVDFIKFIKIRLGIRKEKTLKATESTPLNSGGFFGMWADRGEMSDSAYWVRELRTGEWGNLKG